MKKKLLPKIKLHCMHHYFFHKFLTQLLDKVINLILTFLHSDTKSFSSPIEEIWLVLFLNKKNCKGLDE